MEVSEHFLWILVIIFIPWIIIKISIKSKPLPLSECPVCLGDGRDEGWKTAWPCKACNGTGKYTPNEETFKEISRESRQNQVSAAQDAEEKRKYPYLNKNK